MTVIKLGTEPPKRTRPASEKHRVRKILDLPPRPAPVRGRPPSLTIELVEEFERHLPALAYLESVGDLLGVDRSSWMRWVREGSREAMEQLKGEPPDPDPHVQLELSFYLAYRRGMAEFKRRNLSAIYSASERDWRAAAWLMERRLPETWGDKAREFADIKKQVAELEKAFASSHPSAIPGGSSSGASS